VPWSSRRLEYRQSTYNTSNKKSNLLALFANREYNMNTMLKPQDIVVACKLVSLGRENWTYVRLAYEIHISASEINAGIKRLVKARLVTRPGKNRGDSPKVIMPALKEFVVHGLKYVFPPERGELTRGVPTAYAAPPLNGQIAQPKEPPPVWPDPEGKERGVAFRPLYPTVPRAALEDMRLYEMLALIDSIRDGRARERQLAVKEFAKRLKQW